MKVGAGSTTAGRQQHVMEKKAETERRRKETPKMLPCMHAEEEVRVGVGRGGGEGGGGGEVGEGGGGGVVGDGG